MASNKTIKTIKTIFRLFMILWMITIFCFSSRTGDESAGDSYYAGRFIAVHFIPGYENWSPERQENFAEAIDTPIRKTAHACEYAVLALLTFGADWTGSRDSGSSRGKNQTGQVKQAGHSMGPAGKKITPPGSLKKRAISAWIITSLYAATDEFHQLFVPGRAGQFRDVLLDSAGGMAGIGILLLLLRIYHDRKKKRKSKLPNKQTSITMVVRKTRNTIISYELEDRKRK